MKSTVTLYPHQLESRDFALSRNVQCGLFLDLGLGKTLTTLSIFDELRKSKPGLKMLVICPLSLCNPAWRNDTENFTHYKCAYFKKSNWDLLDIVTVNYESFISVNNLKAFTTFIKRNKVLIVLDESSRAKNPKAKITKELHRIASFAEHRLILSGCPCPNSELEYWGQINFIKPSLLHPSFFAFRNTFFHLERRGITADPKTVPPSMMAQMFQKGWQYAITPLKREQLMKVISQHCIFKKKEDCLNLPEKINVIREVSLGAKELKASREIKKILITEIQGEEITAPLALTKLMKQRQITSGFVLSEGGEPLNIGENSKLKELLNTIEEIEKKPIIIWIQFHHELEQIKEALETKYKQDQVVTLYSKTKDRDASVNAFKNNEARFLIAHPKSAGHGLTFVNCSTQIFYSLNYSYEEHFQAKGRTHRIGQVNTCTYIYLLANESIDYILFEALENKKSLQEITEDLVRNLSKNKSSQVAQGRTQRAMALQAK